MRWKLIFIIITILVVSSAYLVLGNKSSAKYTNSTEELKVTKEISAPQINSNPQSIETNTSLPLEKTIPNLSWVGQSFNNCSSVALMINLSHWEIYDTQEKIAEGTRPWNNPKGNNDDKSVTLYELADYAKEKHGMLTYVRPNGNIETLKKFIANDIPVLTRTLMYPKDDIVHYRVIRGYDESKKIVIESDGVGGPNKKYSYADWMHLWKDFNYSYLIVVPNEKKQLVEKLLGEEIDEQIAWKNAKSRALDDLSKTPNNLIFGYNLVTALYYLGDYEGTIREFEKIESGLTRRKLWYQMEPIYAYFKLDNYDRVIKYVDFIANDHNQSISELYVLKGNILEKRGDTAGAKDQYQKAIYYNKSLKSAQDALKLLK